MANDPDELRFPDPARSRVILIGTGEFERGLDRLPGVRNNLTDLVAVLTNPETGVFAPDETVIVDNPETQRSLMLRLERAAHEAEDVLLVYYAGHGLLGGPDGALHLAVFSTDPDHPEYTAVPFAHVSQAIRDSPARTRILILDCCFSGRAIGAMSGSQAAVRQVDVDGAYTLTATSANHLARALPGERNTAFTGALIALLRTGTLDGTPLTLGTLYRPLRAELARRDLPAPQCRQDNASAALALRRDPSAPPFSPTPVSPTPVSWGGANSARPPRLPAPPGRSWQRHLGRVLLRVGVILFALVLCLFEVGVIGAAATNGYHGDIWTPILSSFCVVVFLGPCVVFLGFEIKRVLEALRD